ncbi:glycoside hydrolase family 2 protein [Baudoinia panamericana UAMH 10762]|uniref:Glycoside hydrolase family 2 protein n=1 Tax=Baudoinia panamericana (strain UAMH 10762) TaxID=717646 RepID=M2N269_BAUPA|nr:glycoside hydrolase family 2 protein [Baudoinia panamericana UAMH 10762]EMC97998.1 glycoside hydrolase family 2 protein [Baudoinia panamericana UAMH 10762]
MYITNVLQAFLVAASVSAARVRRQNTNSTKYAVQTPPLTTNWTYEVGTNPWPQYPRPQLERSQWQTLNGIWTYQNASSIDAVNSPPFNQALANQVLIPSCLESGLSGIQGTWTRYSWFATTFNVPSSWAGDRVLLNFGAIDYEATIFVNGHNASFHRGGYFAFTVDVTSHLTGNSNNNLLIFVHDPTDSDPYVIPIGKQTLHPSHIFYTPCSGIWQSVWIEAAPASHIAQLQVAAGMDGTVNATVYSSDSSNGAVQVSVIDRKTNATIATHSGTANTPSTFQVSSPSLWTPNTPNLYDIVVTMGSDTVTSYTGFRTISRGMVNGIERPLLNGEFIFLFGTLDQGFWPDGIYVPPNYEGMVYDLQTLKTLGFNMLRKHIKVEMALYYQACDEMGLMVIQDMPSLRPLQSRTLPNCTVQTILPDADQQAEFTRQLGLLVQQQRVFPSIVTWVIYNEGWGQITTPYYPEFGLTDFVRSLDPTRLIDSTTGWFDHGAGDFSDNHHYANPQCGSPFYSIQSSPYDPSRIGFQGEFGGTGNNVSIDHLWNVQEAINTINQTYEIDLTLDAWNYRGHRLLDELQDQIARYSCSGGVWTQTTDVEGEVNGLLTYDRRILRPYVSQWQADIQALYSAAAARANASVPLPPGSTTISSMSAATPSSRVSGAGPAQPSSTQTAHWQWTGNGWGWGPE